MFTALCHGNGRDEGDRVLEELDEPEPCLYPKNNFVYNCIVANDGNRLILLDADPEIYYYVNELLCGFAEDGLDLPDEEGVHRCRYKFYHREGGWYEEADSGFDLLDATCLNYQGQT